jgi:hypothetical protein
MAHLIRPRDNATKVYRDDDGMFSGLQVEHWDGRLDAHVLRPRTVRVAIPESERALLRKLAGGQHG